MILRCYTFTMYKCTGDGKYLEEIYDKIGMRNHQVLKDTLPLRSSPFELNGSRVLRKPLHVLHLVIEFCQHHEIGTNIIKSTNGNVVSLAGFSNIFQSSDCENFKTCSRIIASLFGFFLCLGSTGIGFCW